jgi:outer membrane protein assembly factor BamD (BamD/ComL family)
MRENIPDTLRDDLTVEEAKLLLAGKQPDRAVELLREYRKTQKVLRGELSLMYLKGLSELSSIARERGDSRLASELSAQLTADAERFRTEAGGIWGYRCALFVELHKQAAQFGSEYAEQMRTAQNLYRSGDRTEALEAYRSLSDRAVQDGKTDLAAEMAYMTASLELAAQDYAAAGEAYLSIFERFPKSPRAAESHLMWAYVLGKKYEEFPTKTNRELYTQALESHLSLFETSDTAGEAFLMLGQLQESRLQVTKAVTHYLQVPASHRKAVDADLGAVRCYQKILDRLKELNQPQDAWRLEAIDEISKRTAKYPESEQEWTAQQAQVVLGLARLLLTQKRVDYSLVDWLLTRVLRIESPDGEWKPLRINALQLKVLSLAGAGKTREAESILLQLEKTETAQLLSLMKGLNRVTAGADESVRKGIAQLQLKTSLELQKRAETLSEEERKKLGVCLAEAYLAAERSREAREVYEQLVEKYPRETSFKEELGQLYRDCPTSECADRGLTLWKSLEATYRQGSREWLQARKETIRSLIATDRQTEARRLLGITELLYPELGGQELQAEYRALKTKLDRD